MTDENFLDNIDTEDFDIPIFIDENQEICVTLYLGSSKTVLGLIYCDMELDKLKEVAKDDLGKIEEHKFWFRLPNFKDNNDILDKSLKYNDESVMEISPLGTRAERVFLLIKRWTLKKPISKENVFSLSPLVGFMLGAAFELELKKLNLV